MFNFDKIISKKKNHLFGLFLLLIIGFVVFDNFSKAWIVESDSLHFYILARSGGFFDLIRNFFLSDLSLGRSTFFIAIWYRITFIFDNFIYFKTVYFLFLSLDIILFSFLLKKIFGFSKMFLFIPLLILLCFLQNSWHPNGVVVFSNVFSGSLSFLFLSLILYIKYLETNKKYYNFLSLFLYTCSLFTYELYVLYFLFFIAVAIKNLNKNNGFKDLINKIKFQVLLLSLYLFVYFLVKHFASSSYAGVTVSGRFSLINSVKTIWQFSVSSIPGYMLIFDKWAGNMELFKNTMFYGYRSILLNIQPIWIIKFVSVFSLFYIVTKNTKPEKNYKFYILNLILGITYFFIPPVLLSLTSHYQNIVLNNVFLSEPVTLFSFFAFVYVFVTLLIILIKLINNFYLKNYLLMFIGLCIACIGLAVDYSNFGYSQSQELSHYKWEIVNRFINTNEFNNIPENSFIYAPTLFNGIGTVVVDDDDYWSNYVYVKSGKKIIITKDISKISLNNGYFLKYDQQLKDKEQYLVFSKVFALDETKKLFYSSNADIYYYSKYNNFNILGYFDGSKCKKKEEIQIENKKVPDVSNNFVYNIDPSNFKVENSLKRINVSSQDKCGSLRLNDFVVFPGYINNQ